MTLAAVALLHSCCDERIEQQEPSPVGDKTAVVVYRECGAIGGDGTAVMLRSGGSEDYVISASGHQRFIAIWKSEDTLKIFVPQTARNGSVVYPIITRQNNDVRGTHVEYW
jgi:hypothetical protein